ncbi:MULTISPECIES: glutamate synthase-related protein [Actinokineospora]|uniref:Glutamate synthase n=1 Tax=Actinokineospora fastidiosa TaxID=1816 RepID=A0A918GKK4_9PSEU|nr:MULTISPECIES: glutamate synthase-related protein [Actinokineospora]UVS77506.1 Glutamate synthase [NADPH] large chain [Actinokineospora sp. UTMC 2448]GGS42826.1 glutamate synthase [Actinokineospora fastidiosa]
MIRAAGFPEAAVRARARGGPSAVFPDADGYGGAVFGAAAPEGDDLDRVRLVPPVFVPHRLEKMYELGREPLYSDVELGRSVGGFTAPLPVFLCAFGSTQVGTGLGVAVSEQAGRLGVPMVIGENVVPMHGYGRVDAVEDGLLARIRAYARAVPDGLGGVVVQQSTEDADAEVWNLVYSDPDATRLLETGRLAFELKVGQGAKPGLGGMTVLSPSVAAAVADRYALDDSLGDVVLRSSSPGTFTEEILRQQLRLMRNNYPRARVWVKLHPGRDIAHAVRVAWCAGADAVTVDGAEGGTGWAPTVFLDHVGLPLAECLARIGKHDGDLLVSGRIWEGARALKCLARGATAVGLGRAALIAAAEDPSDGLIRLIACLDLELRLLLSALGKYTLTDLTDDDLWSPTDDQL